MELCSLLKYGFHLPLVQEAIKYHQHTLEEPIHECPYKTYRFTKVQCKYSDKQNCINKYCFIKAYSRYNTTMNIGCDFKNELTEIIAETSTSFKTIGNYREIFKHKFELCSALKYGLTSFFLKDALKYQQHTLEEPLHQCPYKA
ncbi:unnamed protein product [Diamesa hyperborea]